MTRKFFLGTEKAVDADIHDAVEALEGVSDVAEGGYSAEDIANAITGIIDSGLPPEQIAERIAAAPSRAYASYKTDAASTTATYSKDRIVTHYSNIQ